MALPIAGGRYDQQNEATTRRQIDTALAASHKRGQDIEMASNRIILTSPNGTRYAIQVSNAGALSTTAV